MIKNLKIFKKNEQNGTNYDLVTIRRYNGIEDGMHSWTFLSYAVVEKQENNKAICFRNKNIEYEYAPEIVRGNFTFCNYDSINVGDIKIFSTLENVFNKNWDSDAIKYFIESSTLYFDDDTKFGKVREKEKVITKK